MRQPTAAAWRRSVIAWSARPARKEGGCPRAAAAGGGGECCPSAGQREPFPAIAAGQALEKRDGTAGPAPVLAPVRRPGPAPVLAPVRRPGPAPVFAPCPRLSLLPSAAFSVRPTA